MSYLPKRDLYLLVAICGGLIVLGTLISAIVVNQLIVRPRHVIHGDGWNVNHYGFHWVDMFLGPAHLIGLFTLVFGMRNFIASFLPGYDTPLRAKKERQESLIVGAVLIVVSLATANLLRELYFLPSALTLLMIGIVFWIRAYRHSIQSSKA